LKPRRGEALTPAKPTNVEVFRKARRETRVLRITVLLTLSARLKEHKQQT
jgi:hypothetical protein